jgi:inosose dehydratase
MSAQQGNSSAGEHVIHVANAPVSYGAFELTVGIDPDVPPAEQVLDAIAGAGYEGVDLGPVGYFGKGEQLARALGQRGLMLAGGYLEVDVSSDDGPERAVADLDVLMECFDAASRGVPKHLRPRPTIALVGAGVAPGDRAGHEAELWSNAERALALLTEASRRRGYEPCLHNELGTLVTRDADIAQALEISDISLCLDTGHFFAGGGDPLDALKRWRDRIYHVHLKDARRGPYQRIIAEARPVSDIWSDGAFCRLGEGEASVGEFVEALVRANYSGWLVVEQDVLPKGPAAYAMAAQDQQVNRAFLKKRRV